jgi:hypothetical protein
VLGSLLFRDRRADDMWETSYTPARTPAFSRPRLQRIEAEVAKQRARAMRALFAGAGLATGIAPAR